MSRNNRLFINNVDDCVDEMLESIALQSPGLRKLEGHRVIMREDTQAHCKAGYVSIISGGGSGHEPFAAGFVGKGMLTAAVAGSVFASPPPADILAAIKATVSPGGTLLIVANYTGDRLNFGIALERAKASGLNVKMVVVGEDCALESGDKTAGRRGLVGIVAIMKIAGSLSEECKSLNEIVEITKSAAENMGTIGVSLSACSIPGTGSSFQLDNTEMELGLGAHGEAGVKRMKIQSADDTISTMIDHMTNASNASRISLDAGQTVSVIVNNLGGLSVMETHVLSRKLICLLESKGIVVDRFYLGHLMTSLDMAGFNFNILKLNNILSSCLDAPTTAPAWPRTSVSPATDKARGKEHLISVSNLPAEKDTSVSQSTGKHVIASDTFLQAIKHTCEALISQEAFLNELDTSSGDGDCGSTLKRGAATVIGKISGWKNRSVAEVLLGIASCAEVSMGGASGGLYSLFFTAASQNVEDTKLVTWKRCIDAGIKSIMEYGKAEPGDRTLLDSLVALSASLNESIVQNKSFKSAIEDASISTKTAAKETIKMKARAGRASYVAPNLLIHADPGATAVASLMESLSAFVSM